MIEREGLGQSRTGTRQYKSIVLTKMNIKKTAMARPL